MKIYIYMCRGKDGTVKRGQLEASDRANALRQLKGQGLVPLSVSEGTLAPYAQHSKRRFSWVAAAAVITVLAVVWFMRSPANPTSKTDQQTSGKAVAASHQSTPKNPAANTLQPPTGQTPVPDAHSGEPLSHPAAAQQNRTTPQAQDNPAENPAEAEVEERDTTLRTQTEKMLALMASVPPGMEIPPMPILPGMEKDFAAALTNVIVIHADDSEAMADRKEKVAWLKQDLATLVQEGGITPGEAIKEIEEHSNRIAKMRSELLQYATALYREGRAEEAQIFIDEANKELNQIGAPPIQLSPRLTRIRNEN